MVNIYTKRSNLQNGVSLIIPALNEEKTIANVIERCAKQSVIAQLVVVNDGSIDQTKEVLTQIQKNFAKRKTGPLLTVIHHPKNLGKGACIKSGLKEVKGKYVMVQDADLEYFPEEIVKLYEKAEQSEGGIVFGKRIYKNKGYLLVRVGNIYLNLMFLVVCGLKLTDAYTCYKMIPRKIWRKLDLQSNGFEIDSELLAKLGKMGSKVIEIPVTYNPRKYQEGKKIKWIDALKATLTALKVRLNQKPISH